MSRTPKDHVHQGKHGRNDRCAPASPNADTIGSAARPSDSTPFLGASSRERERHASGKPPRRPNFITRSVNRWCNRLLGAVSERSLTGQEAEYAAHRTTRDYVWNTVGVGTWGMVFPILTIVVTQLAGVEQAGMFSLAFITALMLMFMGNYGVRTYQASDLD